MSKKKHRKKQKKMAFQIIKLLINVLLAVAALITAVKS